MLELKEIIHPMRENIRECTEDIKVEPETEKFFPRYKRKDYELKDRIYWTFNIMLNLT